MRKIGAVTIGQSPRKDVTKDILPLLKDIEIVECGALDNYTYEEVVEKFQPTNNNIFVSIMRDGMQVSLDKDKLIIELNNCIKILENRGCEIIMVFCTGKINNLESNVTLLQPNLIMKKIIPEIALNTKIAIVVPDVKQIKYIKKQWDHTGLDITFFASSPYDSVKNIKHLSQKIKNQGFGLVYLDCIGYSKKMQEIVSQTTSLPVLLPRTILAEVASLI
ncbi:MAG: AroM family protein [Clostridia bacterium]